MKNHKIYLKQNDSQFPSDKEIRIALRKLGLKDVVFSCFLHHMFCCGMSD
jgi:hypothetical protein